MHWSASRSHDPRASSSASQARETLHKLADLSGAAEAQCRLALRKANGDLNAAADLLFSGAKLEEEETDAGASADVAAAVDLTAEELDLLAEQRRSIKVLVDRSENGKQSVLPQMQQVAIGGVEMQAMQQANAAYQTATQQVNVAVALHGAYGANAAYYGAYFRGAQAAPQVSIEEAHAAQTQALQALQVAQVAQAQASRAAHSVAAATPMAVWHNPRSMPGHPLYERFVAAWAAVPDKKMRLVFHGSAEENMTVICREGLDPRRRAGQAMGPGEYFGHSMAVSHGYCKGGRHMLLFAVLLDRSGVTTDQPTAGGAGGAGVTVINKPEHQREPKPEIEPNA